jgi:hypothetical protein
MLPDPPEISADEMRECRETGDYSPVVFQWYKFVAGVCFTFAALLQETPIVRKDVSKRDYGVSGGTVTYFDSVSRSLAGGCRRVQRKKLVRELRR